MLDLKFENSPIQGSLTNTSKDPELSGGALLGMRVGWVLDLKFENSPIQGSLTVLGGSFGVKCGTHFLN